MSFDKANTQINSVLNMGLNEYAVERNGEKNSTISITPDTSASIHAIEPHLNISEEKIVLRDSLILEKQVCEAPPHLPGVEIDVAKSNITTNSSKTLQNVSKIIPEDPLSSREQILSNSPCLTTSGGMEFLENFNKIVTSKTSGFASHHQIVDGVESEQCKIDQPENGFSLVAQMNMINEEIEQPDEKINDGLPQNAQMYMIKEDIGGAPFEFEDHTVELSAKLNESKGFKNYLREFLLKHKYKQSLTKSIMEAARCYENLDKERRLNNPVSNTCLTYCKALTKKIFPTTVNNPLCDEAKTPPENLQNDDTVYVYEEMSSGHRTLPTTDGNLHLFDLQTFDHIFPEVCETNFDEPSKQLLKNQYQKLNFNTLTSSKSPCNHFSITEISSQANSERTQGESNMESEENLSESNVRCFPQAPPDLSFPYPLNEDCYSESISSNVSRRTTKDKLRQKNFRSSWCRSSSKKNKK